MDFLCTYNLEKDTKFPLQAECLIIQNAKLYFIVGKCLRNYCVWCAKCWFIQLLRIRIMRAQSSIETFFYLITLPGCVILMSVCLAEVRAQWFGMNFHFQDGHDSWQNLHLYGPVAMTSWGIFFFQQKFYGDHPYI